jgi:hypothetical protein
MRSFSRLGTANLALLPLYFVPVWGADAVRALKSPFGGFEGRMDGAMANYLQQVFGFGTDLLLWISNGVAAFKLLAVAGLVAYGIEFARSLVMRRDVDRDTLDSVLALMVISIAISAVPTLALFPEDGGLVRLYATQILLVAGAVVVITVERHIEQSAPARLTITPERESEQRVATAQLTSDAGVVTLRPAA